jgi:hypothetical protein
MIFKCSSSSGVTLASSSLIPWIINASSLSMVYMNDTMKQSTTKYSLFLI